jgi:hypothetical protein
VARYVATSSIAMAGAVAGAERPRTSSSITSFRSRGVVRRPGRTSRCCVVRAIGKRGRMTTQLKRRGPAASTRPALGPWRPPASVATPAPGWLILLTCSRKGPSAAAVGFARLACPERPRPRRHTHAVVGIFGSRPGTSRTDAPRLARGVSPRRSGEPQRPRAGAAPASAGPLARARRGARGRQRRIIRPWW